ncbi:type 1 glutamine amidotransferase domain-containing protein [Luteitalea sp.]|uniref:type 1 glutamine amidotransferase domain-containing protein n=1 Tax=Luteitalea sp. TaxID=2004800 RepID=UPI0025C6E08B|nr:type 1 glutamine amidotransferase domain-containing protein [Luteitalea sp.]
MSTTLAGKKVAILVADGFEQVEMTSPRDALTRAGALVEIVSPVERQVRGWQHTEWGETFAVDHPVVAVEATDYDALVLPGGQMNPDTLRTNAKVVQLVRDFHDAGKPIAAICHGPWLLVEAGIVDGLRLTSYPSIRTDVQNAGGHWQDAEVVEDQRIITSRNPDDLPAFNRATVQAIASSQVPRDLNTTTGAGVPVARARA